MAKREVKKALEEKAEYKYPVKGTPKAALPEKEMVQPKRVKKEVKRALPKR